MIGGWSLKREFEILKTIIGFCDEIEHFVRHYGSDIRDFQENHSLQYGCAFLISQIGEYNKRLSSGFRDEHPGVDWRGAAKMRDIIAHQYGPLNIKILKDTVLNDIPKLKNGCQSILDEMEHI